MSGLSTTAEPVMAFDAPPPAYDFTEARGAPQLLLPAPASSPPAYSAVAEYPSHEELQDRLPATKSIFGSSKIVNIWCGGCSKRLAYKDKSGIKYLSCPKCAVMTPVAGATPRDETKKFVHCDGRCGHQLLIVPKAARKFICPVENLLCRPRAKVVAKLTPTQHNYAYDHGL